MMESVRVSVVVAVYNRENTLDRCLDSLVYQTLEEIEILMVDDQSEDCSMEIMKRWQSLYPDKIRIFSNPDKGVANAKNMGIENARGEYIAFVDSDDYADYRMFARLYECAEQNGMPDIVNSPIWSVSGTKKWKRGVMSRSESVEDYLSLDVFFLPGKLIRRDMFERFGLLPDFGIGEDVSWMFPAISFANSLAYLNVPGYFYELSPDSITVDNTSPQLVEDILKGSERIIRETNGHYDDYAKLYAFKRIVSLSQSRPVFKNRIREYVLQNLYEIESIPNLAKRAPGLYNAIKNMKEDVSYIPQIIYVNGFSGPVTQEDLEQYQRACTNLERIEILDSSFCDLENCPPVVQKAYSQQQMDFVAKYFGMKACYDHGGIFVNRNLVIDGSFDALLKCPSFFGYESNDTFTDNIFGCQPGNSVVGQILQSYTVSEIYEEEFAPLKRRIKTVLIGMWNQVLISSPSNQTEKGYCLYPTETFVYTLPFANAQHITHYKPDTFDAEEYVNIPMGTLQALVERSTRVEIDAEKKKATEKLIREKEHYETLAKRRSEYIAQLEKQYDKLKQDKEELYHSFSWRITKPIRLIGRLARKLIRR